MKDGIEVPLTDSRSKDHVRVKKEALTWWLENGEETTEDILDILSFIEKSNIRQVEEYEKVNFINVFGGGAPIKRQRVQTTIPVLDTFLKRHEIINAIFEGHHIIGHIEEKDVEHIKKIQDVLMPKLIDPNDIIRVTQGLMDKKRRAIPLRPYGGISSREMRHALDGNHWTIEASGLQVTESRKNLIVKDTCGVLISLSITSVRAGAKRLLLRLLDSTYLNNQRLTSILGEMEPSGDYEIIICQSSLGMKVNNSSKFLGAQFYVKSKIPIIVSDENDKFKTVENEKSKLFMWKRKNFDEENKRMTVTTVNTVYKVKSEIRLIHIEGRKASAEAIVNTDKLVSVAVFTKDSRAYVDLISSLIVWAKLWKTSDIPFVSEKSEHKAVLELKKHFLNPKNWPFQIVEGLTDKNFQAEIEGEEIPVFKEISIVPASETNFRAEQISVTVDPDTLVVKKDRGPESYIDVVSKEMVNMIVEKYSNEKHILPSEVVSVDPVIIGRIVDKNKLRSALLEAFFIFINLLDNDYTGLYDVNKELLLELNSLLRFTSNDHEILKKLLAYMVNEPNWKDSIFNIFSISLLHILVKCSDDRSFKRRVYKNKVAILNENPPKIKISVTDVLVCEVPYFQTGNLLIDKLGNLVFMDMPLFNLSKLTVSSDQRQYDYPILKTCELGSSIPHDQVIDPIFKDLYKYVGKHILLKENCFLVEKPSGKTISGLMNQIENNQNMLRIKTKLGMIGDEEEEEGELDEETINFESMFDIFD